jgi:hypothetical protein
MNTATLTSCVQVPNTDVEAGGCSNDIVSTSCLKKIGSLLAKYIKASYIFMKKNTLMLRSIEEKLSLRRLMWSDCKLCKSAIV